MQHIDSIKDPHIVKARELVSPKKRVAEHRCLLAGKERIQWALDLGIEIEYLIAYEKDKGDQLVLDIGKHKIPVFTTSHGIMKRVTETKHLIPFVAVAKLPDYPLLEESIPSFVLVCDGLQDLGNRGTIVRSARAFGVKDIIIPDDETDFFANKTIDASRGLVLDSTIYRFSSIEETIEKLKSLDYHIIGTSSYTDTPLSAIDTKGKKIALIIGNETTGVSKPFLRAADQVVTIPMEPGVESLNVGVAAGICLYQLAHLNK